MQGWSLRLILAADGPPGPPAPRPRPPPNDGPPQRVLHRLPDVRLLPGAPLPGEDLQPRPETPALPELSPDDVVRLLELPPLPGGGVCSQPSTEGSEGGGDHSSSMDTLQDLLGEFALWRDGGSHAPEVGDLGPLSPPGGPREASLTGSIDWDALSLPSAFGTPPQAASDGSLPRSASSRSTPSFYRSPARTPSPEPAVGPAPAPAQATVAVVGRIPVVTLDGPAAAPSQAPSQGRPGLGPDWLGILNNLTQRQLDALNQQATALVLNPDDPELTINLPPREPSGPDDPPEDRDDPQDQDERRDDPPEEDQDQDEDSNLGFIARAHALPVTDDHHPDFRPRSPITAPVTDHRVQSILTAGAKTFIPRAARSHFAATPSSRIIDETVHSLCAAGILREEPFQSCYRLFVTPKSDLRVRVLYDLSPLTPHIKKPACHLPRALDVLSDGEARFAIKVDLSDGFFHIPIHPGLQRFLGVRHNRRSYVWTALPMGLASAPGIMQSVMSAIARLITTRLPCVRARVYLDDFLFTSTSAAALHEIPSLLSSWGLQINHAKSVLQASQHLTYLGISLDLAQRQLEVAPATQAKVIAALRALPSFTDHHASKLAGYVNFIRWVAKLPVAFVVAVLHRDPLIQPLLHLLQRPWRFTAGDYHAWFREHYRWLASDATPRAIGLADPGCALTLPLPEAVPIYHAELAAAYLATSIAPPNSTIYVDNVAALINVHKGRCPREWLPFVLRTFRQRRSSYRWVPSEVNPADLPSRPEH